MTHRRMLLAGALVFGAAFAAPAAMAQQQVELTYVQPLSRQAVQVVQRRLTQAGDPTGGTEGIWGPESVTALQHFQQTHGLQVTGQLNQATVATLGLDPNLLLGGPQYAGAQPPSSYAAPVPSGTISPAAVEAVQARLRTLGFYNGAVDGNWGPETQSALARFQQSRGLQADSQLTPATVAALGLRQDIFAAR
jgi:peptidoglycan hydrolase-like protein with peptidoglycan-binding domain